jgi:hypothetical protein
MLRSSSPDGSRLAYAEIPPDRLSDIWMLPLDVTDPEHPKAGKTRAFPEYASTRVHAGLFSGWAAGSLIRRAPTISRCMCGRLPAVGNRGLDIRRCRRAVANSQCGREPDGNSCIGLLTDA